MQKSNIEWCTHTSNPIRGKCLHACHYCYAERIRVRFKMPEEITFHPKELQSIRRRKKPATIFMGSMHDIFGDWVNPDWIKEIILTAEESPQHTFLFLTKNPFRYVEFDFPDNCWCGSTVVRTTDPCYLGSNRFVSVEPLITSDMEIFADFGQPVIIVGAMTGPSAIRPKKQWVEKIYQQQESPIFLKDNLLSLFPDLPKLKYLPWNL